MTLMQCQRLSLKGQVMYKYFKWLSLQTTFLMKTRKLCHSKSTNGCVHGQVMPNKSCNDGKTTCFGRAHTTIEIGVTDSTEYTQMKEREREREIKVHSMRGRAVQNLLEKRSLHDLQTESQTVIWDVQKSPALCMLCVECTHESYTENRCPKRSSKERISILDQ